MYDYLKELYPKDHSSMYESIKKLIAKYKNKEVLEKKLTEKDSILITYGDSLVKDDEKPLVTFRKFAQKYLKGNVSAIHFLPFFPYSSDDGFSIIDYRKVNESLGDWEDITAIHKDGFDLMIDAVVNHVSKSSHYVQEYLKGNEEYKDFLIESDPNADYSEVVRPRTLPLINSYQHKDGIKHLWTTFSEDQLDINFKNPKVLLEVLDIILEYASHGARFIRLDAIGVIWKSLGTRCMHLPETHKIIKIIRSVLESCYEIKIITETNVPHEDNISYFGNGNDEAALVYQFPLPPLTMYSFLSKDASYLTNWAKNLENKMETNAFFNFLSSHDGIGIRPVEEILDDNAKQLLIDHTINRGGRINYRTLADKSEAPYELNINYLDAITEENDDANIKTLKFIAAHSIMLSLAGVPGIYIHSILGSESDIKGMMDSNINRRINREKLNIDEVEKELNDNSTLRFKVFNGLVKLLKLRAKHEVFNPHAHQEILDYGEEVFAVRRKTQQQELIYVVNVTNNLVTIPIEFGGKDIITNEQICSNTYQLKPYQFIWLKKQGEEL